MLKRLQNALVRLRTWFKQVLIVTRAAFRLKSMKAVPQEIYSSMTQSGSGLKKLNEDLTLEQYLESSQGQQALSLARTKLSEQMLITLSAKYHQNDEKPSSPEL